VVALDRGMITGRCVIDGRTVHHADVVPLLDTEFPAARENVLKFGFRAVLAVPLMREQKAYGTLFVWRPVPGHFSPDEVALLETFARQAAIAIDNVRLFNETREALEQQQASGEVLATISSSISDTTPVFERILESCARLFDGKVVGIPLLGEDGQMSLGAYRGPERPAMERHYPRPADETSGAGTAILRREIQHYPDIEAPGVPPSARTVFRVNGVRAALFAPMLWKDGAIGAIFVGRMNAGPFSDKEIALLRTFASQAVIAIQNARLFNETREALEQQTATAEVLQVISSSVADTAPVFDKILDSCQHLFATGQLGIFLADGDGMVHAAAWRGAALAAIVESFPKPLAQTVTGTVLSERRTIHIPDVAAMAAMPDTVRSVLDRIGNFSCAWAPMIWEGRGVGSIAVLRQPPHPMTGKDLALLKTFADQAVIAIQNVRQFREIQQKSRELEIASQHKSEFLANMSHELRTPLNAIIGFSEVLLERMFGELNEKQDDYLKDIHSSGRHLLSLINDILDLSKVEAGRMELEPARFDVPTAIGNAMTLVRERAQRHGIALGIDVAAEVGEIVADERKFKQILLNLLTNAVKFTPDGGRVDVLARRTADALEVAVRDTGIGIAKEDQAAVFEEFRQVGRHYTNKQEGTGLGLALTRRFVELHGGAIRLESEPGKGSTFTFTIPHKA
jgi:signal transduction histidine kinase